MSRKRAFVVTLKLPPSADLDDAQRYIKAAVSNWYGCLEPVGGDDGAGGVTEGDPMSELDPDTVIVRPMPTRKRFK